MTRIRTLTFTIAAVLLVSGCDRGPSDAELEAASKNAQALVIEVSDHLIDAALEAEPNLTFEAQSGPTGTARSWDCSDGPASDADAIQWVADRDLRMDPAQPTDDLLDPLIDLLLDDGWVLADDEVGETARHVTLTRDGFDVSMAGTHTVDGAQPARVLVETYSPCLEAPAPQP